jgi:hypothetical protein
VANILDAWDASKRAPEPVELARRTGGELAVDALTGRQEFRRAGELVREGVSESGSASDVVKGAGLGVLTAGSFFVPWGRAGRFASGVARGAGPARAAALRSAAGLGDDFLAGEAGRRVGRTVGELSDEASELLRGAGVEPAGRDELMGSVLGLGEAGRGGGFTWDPRTGRSAFDEGFATSVVKGYTQTIPVARFSSSDAVDYLRFVPEGQSESVAQKLAANPRNVVGAWVEPIDGVDHVWLDVSSVLRSRDEALRIGGALGEEGVFDFSTMSTLYLRNFPDYLPGGSRFTPDALRRFGFGEGPSAAPRELPPGRISGESDAPLMAGQALEGDTVLGSVLAPVQAARQFGATSRESAQKIFDEMARRGPLNVVSRDDLKTAGMLEYLDLLGERIRSGAVKMSGDYPEFRQFQPFMDDLGLGRPRLISNKRGETFRPLMKAIADGRYDEVLDDLAIQINNVFTLLDDDVFTLVFYPYMHNATVSGAARTGTPASFLSALSGILSAGAAPMDEAGAVRAVFDWGRAAAKVRGDKLVQVGGDLKKYRSAGQAYIQLVNNPDWLSNRVPGLASKTYVYSMLKMNPKMVRALVIDRVDASARLGAFELNPKKFPKDWAWQTETALATEGVELALGGFAERVVAGALGIPPAAVQENVWSIWRVLRDLRVGNGPSRQSGVVSKSGKTIEDFMAQGKMPKAHRELLEQNLARLEQEVASGGAASRYWEYQTLPASGQRVLVPKTDMPIDGYLPPKIRTPENVAALEGAIGNAEEIGRGLAARAPWAPIALQLSVIGGILGAVQGAGQGVAEASEGGTLTLAAGPAGSSIAAGATIGAAFGGSFGILASRALRAARSVRGFARRKTINPDVQVPLENENGILEDALDAYRSQFINRTSGTKRSWDSMPGTEGLPFLGDAPIGRLGKDYYQAIESVQWYLHGAGGGTGDLRRALLNTDIAVPFDLIQDNGPAFASFVDKVLIRAFNGGPGGNVVFNATGDGVVLNGGALKGKYVVANVTDDFIDPVTYSFRDEVIASAEGRRSILQSFRKMYAELGTGIQDDPKGVIYAYNTDDPSYLGFFQFTRKSVFGKETPNVWGPESSGLGYNEARELVFMGGTLADSQEEAFRLATQRGQLFVKDAATGRNVRVPDSFVGESVQLDRITIPPSTRGKNIADQLDIKYDGGAARFYAGRGTADDVLDEIYKLQKFDKPTILVNDAEAEILIREHGYIPLYRGIEFEGLVDGYDATALRNEILNSATWRNEIAPMVTSETEANRYIREIIDAKKYYEAKYQNEIMDAWLNQEALVSKWKDFPGLLSDVASMQNSYTFPRSISAEWAEQIWGPLAKPENAFVPDQMVKEFASGKYYPGVGSHGSGTYTTPNLQRAMGYGGIGTYDDYDMAKNGFVYGILLKPDAKIMGPAEYESFVNALRFWPNQVGYDDIGNRLASSPWGDELSKLFKVQEIDPGVFEYALRDSFADVGRAIAAIGYDGYIPHGTVYGYQKPEYVLLNRQSFVVINHPIQPVTIDAFGVNSYDVSTFVDYPLIEVPLQ